MELKTRRRTDDWHAHEIALDPLGHGCSLLLIGACSSPSGVGNDGGVHVVGSSGASVTLAGVTLDVPANAVSADTPIAVAPTATPSGYALVSGVYQFGAAGTTFAQPVAVTIPLTTADPNAHLFWSNAAGGFDDLGGTVGNPSKLTMTAVGSSNVLTIF